MVNIASRRSDDMMEKQIIKRCKDDIIKVNHEIQFSSLIEDGIEEKTKYNYKYHP